MTGQIYSMDCVSTSVSSVHPYYVKLVLTSLFPIVVIFVSTSIWGIVALVRKRKEYLTQHLVSTIVVVLFVIHPNIVKTSIALFSCTEIDEDEWWLMDEQDIR